MLNKLLMRTTLLAVAASSSLAHADGGFEVTVTNLTRGQQFTPFSSQLIARECSCLQRAIRPVRSWRCWRKREIRPP